MIKILKHHGIEGFHLNGRIWAQDNYTQYGLFFQEWIDITNWGTHKLYSWLGY